MLIRVSSCGCSRHMANTSCSGLRDMCGAPMELPHQHLLDPVHSGCDVRRGEPRDLGDLGGFDLFEVQEHDLTIDGAQPVDRLVDAFEGALAVDDPLLVSSVLERLGN